MCIKTFQADKHMGLSSVLFCYGEKAHIYARTCLDQGSLGEFLVHFRLVHDVLCPVSIIQCTESLLRSVTKEKFGIGYNKLRHRTPLT